MEFKRILAVGDVHGEFKKLKTLLKTVARIDNQFFFAHAGIAPEVPLEKQRAKDLLGIGECFFQQYEGKCRIVVGHHIAV